MSYLIENRHIGVKRCKHGIFAYNRNDSFIGKSLDQYGEWCEFEIELLRNFLKPGDVVIDVGANIGTHAVAFPRQAGSIIADRYIRQAANAAAFGAMCGGHEPDLKVWLAACEEQFHKAVKYVNDAIVLANEEENATNGG